MTAAAQSPADRVAEIIFPTPKAIDPFSDTEQWWLQLLVDMLLQRQPTLVLRAAYVEGDHPLPQGDRRYMSAMAKFRELAETNYIRLVTDAPVQRMSVRHFNFGPKGQPDADAQAIWAFNNMALKSDLIHQRSAKYGMSYALVSPMAEGQEWPTITAEDPRCAIVFPDPTDPTKSLAGLRLWEDQVSGYVLAVLYLPDMIHFYQGPAASDIKGMTNDRLRSFLGNLPIGAGGFTHLGSTENTIGEIPLVEYVWRPGSGDIPEGEAGRDLIKIQNRINLTIFQRIVITHFQAYKQRYVTGADLKTGRKGNKRSPLDPGVDMVWVSKNPGAKFGEFSSADIGQILDAVESDVGHMAAISQTPSYYLMGKMANISGETLTQADAGLVSKTLLRMNSMGWSHERVMKLCFAYLKDDRSKDVHAQTVWANAEKQITAELALAGYQWFQSGIPLEVNMDRQGFTQDQIEFSANYRDEQEAKQQALQDKQMAQQHTQAMALAQVSKPPGGVGKPSSTPTPKKSLKPSSPGGKSK